MLRPRISAYISSILDRHYGPGRVKHVEEARVNSSSVTNAQLARLFATCVREISRLLSILKRGDYVSEAPLSTVYEVSFKVFDVVADFRARKLFVFYLGFETFSIQLKIYLIIYKKLDFRT